jgi:hypothetical protein
MTPLSLAVLHKAEDVVDLLLESGADCRCATARGVATRQHSMQRTWAAQHTTATARARLVPSYQRYALCYALCAP